MNSDVPILYGDLTTRLPPTLAGFCMKTHRVVHCPGELDIYCAGFPCKDFSFLNGSRQCLSGPNAKVFHGVCNYIKYKQPAVFILENVDGITKKDRHGRSPLHDVMAFLRSIKPYRVRWFRLPTQNYYLPQCRNRIYFVGVHLDKVNLRVDMDLWQEDLARLEAGKDLAKKLSVLHCMYDEESKPVKEDWYQRPSPARHKGKRML